MTAPADLLAAIGDRLEAAGIPYMVVGSMAGSFHGYPRTTADIDIVIDPTADSSDARDRPQIPLLASANSQRTRNLQGKARRD